ncbi:hypothetical protein CBER1_02568 [Cercospora berteroae]|uniref:Calcofluor white hypersensitive protein n=2 Tax=Cercospora TaxID=29002 RepID=A0A2S6CEK1_9PEZI|nr:uncharacterized protein CKM354_000547800 [Cercospora kikuchii]PPJ58144.1 hypothetical protein CBER1_02568 [Cercospora berteroae]GIZ42200.1 hypothetical protein CKM354_000547800 [Cercospora kikuchii]
MSNRAVTILGGTVLAGAGYYLYTAGGDPKVAQKQVEADAAKASREVKSHLPGSTKEAKKDAELYGEQAQSKFNQLVRDGKQEASKVDAKLEEYRKDAQSTLNSAAKDAQANANKAIDQFDQKVTEGASKAKSGISSWFGGK